MRSFDDSWPIHTGVESEYHNRATNRWHSFRLKNANTLLPLLFLMKPADQSSCQKYKKTGVYKALNSDGIPAKVRHFSSKVFKKAITLTACPGSFISACHCDLLSHITPFRVDTRGSAASSRTTIARHLAQLVRYWKNNRNKGQY